MKPNSGSKKILIILALIAVILCLPYYVVFSDIKSKNEKISDLEHEFSLSSQKQEYASSLQEEVRFAQPSIELLNTSIIPTDGNVGFIENLEKMGRDEGLEVSIESLTEEERKEFASSTVNILNVQVKTKGSWDGTYHFLKQVESLPFKLTVTNFAIQGTVDTLVADKKTAPVRFWQSSFEIRVLKYK